MKTIYIADAGGGRPGFGYGGDIIDHATLDRKVTLCGREILTVLEVPWSQATNPCKQCTSRQVKNK